MSESKYVTHVHAPVQGLVIGEYNRVQSTYQNMAEESGKDNSPVFDVCIVCALEEEVQAVLDVITQQCHVSFQVGISRQDGYEYRFTTIQNLKGEALSIHVSWLPNYGPLETGLHFKSVLKEFCPRFAIMTGICAGDKGRVNLGDLVIADRAFLYDNGKFVQDTEGKQVYQHDVTTYNADPKVLQAVRLFDGWKPAVATFQRPHSLRQQCDWLLNTLLDERTSQVDMIPRKELEQCAPDWRRIVHALQESPTPYITKERVLRDPASVRDRFYGRELFPFVDPEVATAHVAVMASSSAVRSNSPFQEVQKPVRKAIGIDMEGAAFYRTVTDFGIHALLVKGVCDYADRDKDDTYHHYAAKVSAAHAVCFLQAYVTSDRQLPRPMKHQ